MIVRKRLDISWPRLIKAAGRGLLGADAARAVRAIETAFGDGPTWPCLSVRTGFDATLAALRWPAGSEVLVSAITIPGMTRILEAHGLVPVPVEIDVATTAVRIESAERAISPRTRGILAAPLFGSRDDGDELFQWAKSRDLFLFADHAQAFVGPDRANCANADVTMFSFGPIKTATALSSAVLRFRDGDLRRTVEESTLSYPSQSNFEFLLRASRFAAVKALGYPPAASAAATLVAATGRDPDRVASEIAQSFPGPDFLKRIRRRPSAASLAALAESLSSFDAARLAARQAAGEFLRERLGSALVVPGGAADRMTYWTFPLLVADPDATMRALRRLGYDATRRSSLIVVDSPPARDSAATDRVRAWFDRMIFLPFDVDLSRRRLARMADGARRFAEPFPPKRFESDSSGAAERSVENSLSRGERCSKSNGVQRLACPAVRFRVPSRHGWTSQPRHPS